MARTYSQTLDAATTAPDFALPAAHPEPGRTYTLADFADAEVLVVVFICNHCPYVIHIEDELVRLANDYAGRGVQLVGISANDSVAYPADAPDRMTAHARDKGYPFPYLFDETQSVAKAYGAMCTPDLYVFDKARRLAYHGRLDETRPGGPPAHGTDLRRALDAVLATGTYDGDAHPSMGCNIKWKPGNAPAYYG